MFWEIFSFSKIGSHTSIEGMTNLTNTLMSLKVKPFQICEGHFLMVEENSIRIIPLVFHLKK